MQEISPSYYRDHFWQVIEGVETRHGFLLADYEIEYIKTLRSLSLDAVSLYIRLANRKGPLFRANKLMYDDITCLKTALKELQKHNLVFEYQLGNQIDKTVLNCFNQKELYAFLKGHTFKRFSKKADLFEWLNSWDECHGWLQKILIYEPIIHLSAQDLWPFFKFLFFGELTDNLSGFVVRELGHVVNENFSATDLKPLFTARYQAENAYRLANIYNNFRIMREEQSAEEIYQWWQLQNINRENLCGNALYLFDRLIGRLGRLLEREGENELAISLYQTSPVAPSRERLARLYIKYGKLDKARATLHQMLDSTDGEEAYAGKQLLARIDKTKRCSDARELLNQGPFLQLDYEIRYAEKAVIEHYNADGWRGIHSENWLWNNLFGLVFWDIIYDTSYGAFNHPLQFAPSDLCSEQFYLKRHGALEKRLDLLDCTNDVIAHIQQIFAAKNGIANPFVNWHESLLPLIEILLNRAPADSLKSILRQMATNVKLYRRGFPDLFIWNDDDYRFIEVKATGDQISPQQFHWLQFFTEKGLNCAVQRVQKVDMVVAA